MPFCIASLGWSHARAQADCCSCAFTETKEYVGSGDFPCSFKYPAHWEVSYDRWENQVYIRAPRCETRCGGSNSLGFQVSPGNGKDNNALQQEESWRQSLTPAGSARCGGRELTAYRSLDSKPDQKIASLLLHVGKGDGKNYDASIRLSCSNPGEWQKLEKLVMDSLH